jgi:hypothetical protein
LTSASIDRWLLSPASAAAALPQHCATAEDVTQIRGGRPIGFEAGNDVPDGATVAVLDSSGGLLCLAEVSAQATQLLPRRVLID